MEENVNSGQTQQRQRDERGRLLIGNSVAFAGEVPKFFKEDGTEITTREELIQYHVRERHKTWSEKDVVALGEAMIHWFLEDEKRTSIKQFFALSDYAHRIGVSSRTYWLLSSPKHRLSTLFSPYFTRIQDICQARLEILVLDKNAHRGAAFLLRQKKTGDDDYRDDITPKVQLNQSTTNNTLNVGGEQKALPTFNWGNVPLLTNESTAESTVNLTASTQSANNQEIKEVKFKETGSNKDSNPEE